MIKGQPQFAPWQDDPDPPDYWEEQDYEEMRARLRKYWGSTVEDADFDETLHPRDPEGKFARTTKERVEAAIEKAYKELHPNPLAEHQIGFGNEAGTGVVMMELENYTEIALREMADGASAQERHGHGGHEVPEGACRRVQCAADADAMEARRTGREEAHRYFQEMGFRSRQAGPDVVAATDEGFKRVFQKPA